MEHGMGPVWMRRLLGDALPPPPRTLADIGRFRSLASADPLLPPPRNPSIGSWTTVDIPSLDGDSTACRAEIVTPSGNGPHPMLIWLHGGAWCLGNAAAARGMAAQFATKGFLVVNLDYSLAPEHPFPRAINDTLAALSWASQHAEDHGGDPARITAGGTSAGANLAVAACLALAGEHHPEVPLPTQIPGVHALLLLYGVFDFILLNGDERDNAGYIEVMYNRAYLGASFSRLQAHPLVSPARSSLLTGLPRTMVSVGALDHLLPQSLALVDALSRHDVSVSCRVAADLDHSFDAFDDRASQDEIEQLTTWLASCVADGG